jgi:hypothetical protein
VASGRAQAADERGLAAGLDDEVEVVRLDREVDDAEARSPAGVSA